MKAISDQRLGEYIKTAFSVLQDNGYECRSSKLIEEMKKLLTVSDYEKFRNRTDQEERWVTYFRFNTIGLVKGGYIKKQKRVWYLTDFGKRLLPLTALEIVEANHVAYLKWLNSRDLEKESEYPELQINSDEILVNMEMNMENKIDQKSGEAAILWFEEIFRSEI